MPNPFIQRGLPLSELIQRQGSIPFEGESPFNRLMGRRKLGQINQAIDRFGRPQPMPQPMPQPQPMQPRPMPQPMPQPQPQPMPPSSAAIVGPAGMGTSPMVSISGGGGGGGMPAPGMMGGRGAPSFSGFWNSLGLGGQIPGMGGPRGFGYGGMPGLGGGPPLFRGFGTGAGQQSYMPTPGMGGFNRLY